MLASTDLVASARPERNSVNRTAAGGAALLLGLTACGGGERLAAPATTVTVTVTSAGPAPAVTTAAPTPSTTETSTSPAAPSTPTSAASNGPVKLGREVPFTTEEGLRMRVAALDYDSPVATRGPQASDAGMPKGYAWAAADVRVCLDENDSGEDVYVSHEPWTLVFSDGSRESPSSTGYTNFPKPGFPWGATDLVPGQCVRGKIVYAVPRVGKPSHVIYDGGPEPIQWTLH